MRGRSHGRPGWDAELLHRSDGGAANMQRPRPETRRHRRSADLCVISSARLTARPGRPCDGRGGHYLTWWGVAGRKCPPAVVGAALIVGSALAFALDGPVARAAADLTAWTRLLGFHDDPDLREAAAARSPGEGAVGTPTRRCAASRRSNCVPARRHGGLGRDLGVAEFVRPLTRQVRAACGPRRDQSGTGSSGSAEGPPANDGNGGEARARLPRRS